MLSNSKWQKPVESELVQDAMKNPELYCLKILREGGAEGNLFGKEIIPKLEEMKENSSIRNMYILMKKIEPDVVENTLSK